MIRMRTIDKAYTYLKEQDPETALTKTAFRRFINQGYIPVTQVGINKKLVNLDNVDKFLETGIPDIPLEQIPGIRRIL